MCVHGGAALPVLPSFLPSRILPRTPPWSVPRRARGEREGEGSRRHPASRGAPQWRCCSLAPSGQPGKRQRREIATHMKGGKVVESRTSRCSMASFHSGEVRSKGTGEAIRVSEGCNQSGDE